MIVLTSMCWCTLHCLQLQAIADGITINILTAKFLIFLDKHLAKFIACAKVIFFFGEITKHCQSLVPEISSCTIFYGHVLISAMAMGFVYIFLMTVTPSDVFYHLSLLVSSWILLLIFQFCGNCLLLKCKNSLCILDVNLHWT